jgi:hypothetical protein
VDSVRVEPMIRKFWHLILFLTDSPSGSRYILAGFWLALAVLIAVAAWGG